MLSFASKSEQNILKSRPINHKTRESIQHECSFSPEHVGSVSYTWVSCNVTQARSSLAGERLRRESAQGSWIERAVCVRGQVELFAGAAGAGFVVCRFSGVAEAEACSNSNNSVADVRPAAHRQQLHSSVVSPRWRRGWGWKGVWWAIARASFNGLKVTCVGLPAAVFIRVNINF